MEQKNPIELSDDSAHFSNEEDNTIIAKIPVFITSN